MDANAPSRAKPRETDVAAPVVAWLRDMGWTVYQEVSQGYASRRADIVATRGPLVWVVECKTSLGFAVLEQAQWWLGHVHYTSVAIPRWPRCRQFAERVCREWGIGVFSGREQVIPPRLFRRAVCSIRRDLDDAQQQIGEAGSAGGGYWTPFGDTSRDVVRFVADNPGCSLKEMIAGISHHYSKDTTARTCLAKWIGRGIIKGVRAEYEGRAIRLYPVVSEALVASR